MISKMYLSIIFFVFLGVLLVYFCLNKVKYAFGEAVACSVFVEERFLEQPGQMEQHKQVKQPEDVEQPEQQKEEENEQHVDSPPMYHTLAF